MGYVQALQSRFARAPWLGALLAQVAALLLIGLLLMLLAQLSPWRPSLLLAAGVQGVLAAGLSRWFGLGVWWQVLGLLFVPAVLLANQAQLPAWVFAVGFVLVLLLNWNSATERVPLYLTGKQTREQLATLLERRSDELRFVDLGCGPAGTLLALAKTFPRGQFVGVETAPLSFAIAWLRCMLQPNCTIRYQSLWCTDLAEFNVVYCFLSPVPMPALWLKAKAQMPPSAWLISNTFAVPGVEADECIEMADWRQSNLLLWHMQADDIR